MDDIAEGVLAFIRGTEDHPLPPDTPTRDVLAALRRRLDADAPGWRGRAFGADPEVEVLEVEVHLSGGRVVRGALARRPSEVRGEAA
jgi:hypothetical protein